MVNKTSAAALALMASIALLAGPATAEDFYKGKRVKIIVGYSTGGGYDVYARMLARAMGPFLPGNPSVVVQNMTGAGSLKAANYIYGQAPKDGTVFGTFGRSMPLLALTSRGKSVRFVATKYTWLGTPASYGNDAYVLMARAGIPVKSIHDLMKKDGYQLIEGTTAVGSTGTDVPLVLRRVLGLNIKFISGYPGGGPINIAIDRKEVDARMVGLSSMNANKPEWLKDRKLMRPLLQFARRTRHPRLPDIPTAYELATSQSAKDMIEMMEMPFLMARPYAAPPGIPAERAKILRSAFMKAVNSKGYLDNAKKLGMDISPRSGEEILAMVNKMNALPKELIKRYENILANPGMVTRKVNWQIVTGTISKVKKKGKLEFKMAGKDKTFKTRMRKGYTKVKINGKKAKRKHVKTSMTCKIWWEGNKSYAGKLECAK